jgi:K+-sensing histidine kinase KdpD
MLGFGAGLIIGFFAGAIATIVLLLLIQAVPDADIRNSSALQPWRFMALAAALLIAVGVILMLVHVRRMSYATSLMLVVVFVVAHLRGMLVSWIALALAGLWLCVLLPPARSLAIENPRDQVLVVFFLLCGAIGTRMIAQPEKST